ncbi:MAG: hypothetical protein Kow0090_07760 [Myxococcota bacterium]
MQKFIIKSPNGHLLEHNMKTDMITVGRDPSNDIVLNAPSVSRRHARIYIWEGKYCIEDLGSSNGVYVNGHKISEAVAIDPSCRIDVGGFELSFGAAPAPAAGGTNISQIMRQRPATSPAVSSIRLIGLSEPVRDQVFPLPVMGEATVGRADTNSVAIHHNSISRNHARIIVGGGKVVVQDLGSSNGTYVNGQKISKQDAPPGAEIRFGHVVLRLDDPNSPSAAGVYKPSSAGSPYPEKLTQLEMIKYAIIFLVLIIFMLILTIVLVHMLSSSPSEGKNQPAIPPTAVQPLKSSPDK